MRCAVISPEMYTYGAMLIGGVLRDAGHEVSLRNRCSADPGEMVFLSLYSTQHLLDPAIRAFVARHREAGGVCVAGGPVSAYPEIVLGELAPDAVVVGEGEQTVRDLAAGTPVAEAEGVAFREGGDVVVRPRAPPASIEHPLPLIPDDIAAQSIRGANVYIETHRGCIGACTFCQVPRFFGRTIRSRDIGRIVEEVEAFREKGARRISISGGTGSLFNYAGSIDNDAVIELLAALAGVMGPKNVSAPDIRVDCINDEILEAIRAYTIGWIFFGLESGSDRILRRMGKGATVAQAEEAVAQCRNHGLHPAGSFIVGYPTETAEDYEATKAFIAANPLDDIFISIAEPIPRTPLAELVLATPREENPTYMPHAGEYRSLLLTESEARSFDLMLHADMYKPGLHVVTDQVFSHYLGLVRKDGEEVRRVTELLVSYEGGRRR
ncbi:MAG: methyl-coenzyme M reductase glutamine C-methyltransferase [Methanomicrobiaceae archaeon]|nr:methyl-coenzyme M reductase glutamine C-methyltransferase [Methanomicrobiaceae archaeon]